MSSSNSERMPYERPQLGRVRLEADQVLTNGCKQGGGPNHGFDNACSVGPCNSKVSVS